MKLWIDLFSTDYGLMSLVVILCVLGMALWFLLFFQRHMQDPAPADEA